MDGAGAIAAFLDHRRARGVSTETLTLYTRWLGHWRTWRTESDADIGAIAIAELRAYLAHLTTEHVPHGANPHRPPSTDRAGLAPATVETAWRILRAFWRFCEGEGWLTTEQARFFTGGRIPHPKVPEQARPAASADLVARLLAAIAAAPHDAETRARDTVMVRLLYESGLRVSELCRLSDRDVQIEECTAKTVGKGGKFRYVFWSEATSSALRQYLRLRRGPVGGVLLRGTSERNDRDRKSVV